MARLEGAALAGLLLIAAALRVLVVITTPNFFSPGDPAIYYAMARGCLETGAPRIGFLWHFLNWPAAAIGHVEDYYEPAFAYLIALPMLVTGPSVVAAASMSVVMGVLTVLLVHRFARPLGPAIAIAAAGLVAIEPWSVWYGGLLMKEATVAAVVVVFLYALARSLSGERPMRRTGVVLGVATVAASLIQYELLPILVLTSLVALWRFRRPWLGAYVVAVVMTTALLALGTWMLVGVPITAKVRYVLGAGIWAPFPSADGSLLGRLLPLPYVPASIVGSGYPIVFLLAALGATSARVARPVATVALAFAAIFLYVHGVARDLWPRDFIVLTAVLAPLVAAALLDRDLWRTARHLPLAIAALACAVAAPWIYPAFRRIPWDAEVALLWEPLFVTVVVVAAAWAGGLALRRMRAAAPLARALPAALVGGLLVSFAASLPPGQIYRNPVVRDYEAARSTRERVCARLKGLIPRDTVMSPEPWEVQLYSGLPAVILPRNAPPDVILGVGERYRARYLFLRAGELPDPLLRRLDAREVAALEDYRLYRIAPAARAPR